MEGKTLSHFRIQSKIGEGGMGVIYTATDTKLGRTVALKLLPPALVGDENRKNRFLTEARTAAAVTHPNIATVHEIDEVDGNTFIAMELLDGDTLRAHIGGQPLPIKESLRIAAEIAEGIAAAHQAGILHRDLKPENVMITRSGHVKILDFGLAQLGQTEHVDTADGSTLTAEGHILGTPAYMSPEQARGMAMDSRSDIFSFGSTLYEMLTGKAPFTGRTATDTISQVLNQEPVPPVNFNPDVPENLQWILSKCLNKDPSQRYQDARDIAVDLRHILTDSGSQAPGTTQTVSGVYPEAGASAPFWKRPVFIVAAVAAIAAAFIVPRLTRDSGVPPAEANSLAVFSFENLKDPADPERLGQILQELLITDLSGAEPVKVLSSQRLYDVQKQLGIDKDSEGREFTTRVATRAGAGKMLTGSLSQLGEKWILAAQVVDVRDGTVIQSQRIDGTDLYDMVDILTDQIQSELRLTAATELAAAPIREKTTESLEAYRHYLAGVELISESNFDEAVVELSKAVELDPNFGQAHYKLAIAQWWPGDNPLEAMESINKILDAGLYATEDERLMAEATLALIEQRRRDALEIYDGLVQRRPDDKEVWYGMGEGLFHFPGEARRGEALAPFKKAVELDPDFRLPYHHIFDIYLEEKDVKAANAEADAGLARDPSDPFWHRFKTLAVAMEGDKLKTEQAIEKALVYNTTVAEKKELFNLLRREPDERGDYLGVVEYTKRALAADPTGSDPGLELQIANTFSENLDREEFQRHIREGFAKYPTHPGFVGSYLSVLRFEEEWPRILEFAESLAVAHAGLAPATQGWLVTAIELGNEDHIRRARAKLAGMNRPKGMVRSFYITSYWMYRRMGREAEAQNHLNKARDLTPEMDPNMYSIVANAANHRGDYPAAWEALMKGLELKPDHLWLNAQAGTYALVRNDLETTAKYFGVLLEHRPLNSRNQTGRFGLELYAGRIAGAEKVVTEALKILPTPDERRDFLRDVYQQYFRVGEVERARKTLARFVAMDPGETWPNTIEEQGRFAYVTGDLEQAERHLLRGLEKFPRDSSMLMELFRVRLARKDYAGAETALNRRIEDHPIRATNARARAMLRSDQGDFNGARSFAEEASGDSSRTSAEYLAWVLVAGDLDVQRGQDIAMKNLGRPPSSWDMYLGSPHRPPLEETLGLAALKQERYTDAVKYLEQAADINSQRPSIRENLERARALAGGNP